MRSWTRLLWLWAGVLLPACTDLSAYATRPGEAYEGRVRGTRDASFVRRGFPAGTTLRMSFDPLADRVAGVLRTDDVQCGEPTFAGTELLVVEPLRHDALSLFDFPGEERVRNYLLVARPQRGPLSGRDVTVVVSLLEDGGAQVRVVSGPGHDCPPDDCAARARGECDYFGVFDLRRPEGVAP